MSKISTHLDFSLKSLFILNPLTKKERKGRKYVPLSKRHYPGEEKHLQLREGTVCYIDEGKGRPLVFIHGLSGNLNWWSLLIPEFKNKFRVIALDLPGHGKSGKTFKNYKLHSLTKYLAEFLELLDLKDPILVGYSMGGALTLQYLIEHPGRIRESIVIAPAGVRQPHHPIQQIVAKTSLHLPFLKKYLFPRAMAGSVTKRPEEILQIIYNSMYMTQDPDWKHFHNVVMTTTKDLLSFSVQDRLHHIKTRLLAIWGEDDALEPVGLASVLKTKTSNTQIEIIPECGHQPMFESPQILIQEIKKFIK